MTLTDGEPYSLRMLLKADARRYGLTSAGAVIRSVAGMSTFWLVVLHRAAHAMRRHSVPVAPLLLKSIGQLVWGAEIWPDASFGAGLVIAHAQGVVVGSGVRVGANCTVFSGVVLGSSSAHMRDGTCEPTIGDDVTLFAHAVVVGGTKVASGSTIHAGSVISDDFDVTS